MPSPSGDSIHGDLTLVRILALVLSFSRAAFTSLLPSVSLVWLSQVTRGRRALEITATRCSILPPSTSRSFYSRTLGFPCFNLVAFKRARARWFYLLSPRRHVGRCQKYLHRRKECIAFPCLGSLNPPLFMARTSTTLPTTRGLPLSGNLGKLKLEHTASRSKGDRP